jgi:hypothetical protein
LPYDIAPGSLLLGEGKMERGAFAHSDSTQMRPPYPFHDPLTGSQANARPLVLVLGVQPLEGLKNLPGLIHVHPDAGIRHGK